MPANAPGQRTVAAVVKTQHARKAWCQLFLALGSAGVRTLREQRKESANLLCQHVCSGLLQVKLVPGKRVAASSALCELLCGHPGQQSKAEHTGTEPGR